MKTAIIISLIAIFFAYLESRNRLKYGLLVAMGILTVFLGIRYEWGTDMPTYYANFRAFADSGLSIFDFKGLSQIRDTRSAEIGWAMLNILCKPIGAFGMIILFAIIENLIIYDTIKRYVDKEYYWLAVFIYTMNPYMMVLGCSMIRQWMAMCIILFSVRYIISGRFWLFALFIYLAASVHSSAFVFILLYALRYIRVNSFSFTALVPVAFAWIFVGFLFVGPLVGPMLNMFFFEGYETYMSDQEIESAGLGFGGFIKIVLCMFCILQSVKMPEKRNMYCLLMVMYIFLFPLTSAVTIANRLNLYIEALAIVAIPIAMKSNSKKGLNIILLALLIILNATLYLGFFNAGSYKLPYAHYHTIFEAPYWM